MTIPNELRNAAARVQQGEAVVITVRTLLGWFGMKRRGYNNVARLRAALRQAELITEPPFDQTWIDAQVRLWATAPIPPAAETNGPASVWLDLVVSDMRADTVSLTDAPPSREFPSSPVGRDPLADPSRQNDVGAAMEPLTVEPAEASPAVPPSAPYSSGNVEHRLEMLDSANLGDDLVTVNIDDSIQRVITIMSVRDFSQVPVLRSPGHCLGIVTWRSIGRFVSVHGNLPPRIDECLEPVQVYTAQRNLFEVVDDVSRAGCVLVRAHNSTRLTGLVTVSDLSHLFGRLLEPFVLAGEIETGLRALLVRLPPGVVSSPPDAWTIGTIQRELERAEVWQRLALPLDQREFLAAIGEVREIRNDLMHFTPEETEPRDDERLRDFARFLRELLRD
jgi:CBS domain-containing protein